MNNIKKIMILPVYTYGQPVLRKKCQEISPNYPELQDLISNMWETMYQASGVGIAAPQVGKSIRLFVIDSEQILQEDSEETGFKKVFMNAEILEENGEEWAYEEGCLSIPQVRGDVERHESIKIRYQDENFNEFIETYSGINARVIQHEYDHIEGVLFTEKLKPIKKRMVQRKLDAIRKGNVSADYKLKVARSKR
jgi:peptide deformylase